jgi:hypothetical protein
MEQHLISRPDAFDQAQPERSGAQLPVASWPQAPSRHRSCLPDEAVGNA